MFAKYWFGFNFRMSIFIIRLSDILHTENCTDRSIELKFVLLRAMHNNAIWKSKCVTRWWCVDKFVGLNAWVAQFNTILNIQSQTRTHRLNSIIQTSWRKFQSKSCLPNVYLLKIHNFSIILYAIHAACSCITI